MKRFNTLIMVFALLVGIIACDGTEDKKTSGRSNFDITIQGGSSSIVSSIPERAVATDVQYAFVSDNSAPFTAHQAPTSYPYIKWESWRLSALESDMDAFINNPTNDQYVLMIYNNYPSYYPTFSGHNEWGTVMSWNWTNLMYRSSYTGTYDYTTNIPEEGYVEMESINYQQFIYVRATLVVDANTKYSVIKRSDFIPTQASLKVQYYVNKAVIFGDKPVPTINSITSAGNNVMLSWTVAQIPSNVTVSYEVFRKPSTSDTFVSVGVVTTKNFTDTVSTSGTFDYKVSTNVNGVVYNSEKTSITVNIATPTSSPVASPTSGI